MIKMIEYGSDDYLFKICILFIVFDVWWNDCIYIHMIWVSWYINANELTFFGVLWNCTWKYKDANGCHVRYQSIKIV